MGRPKGSRNRTIPANDLPPIFLRPNEKHPIIPGSANLAFQRAKALQNLRRATTTKTGRRLLAAKARTQLNLARKFLDQPLVDSVGQDRKKTNKKLIPKKLPPRTIDPFLISHYVEAVTEKGVLTAQMKDPTISETRREKVIEQFLKLQHRLSTMWGQMTPNQKKEAYFQLGIESTL